MPQFGPVSQLQSLGCGHTPTAGAYLKDPARQRILSAGESATSADARSFPLMNHLFYSLIPLSDEE